MAKYSFDFKLKVIQLYLKSNGYCVTDGHFNIDKSNIDKSAVRKWAKACSYHGQSGIYPTTKQTYSSEFKRHAEIYVV